MRRALSLRAGRRTRVCDVNLTARAAPRCGRLPPWSYGNSVGLHVERHHGGLTGPTEPLTWRPRQDSNLRPRD